MKQGIKIENEDKIVLIQLKIKQLLNEESD